MLMGFIRNRAAAAEPDAIREIELMLERTWDLTTTRPVKAGAPDARAVTVFNTLFGRLNRTITAILRNVVSLAALTPELIRFSTEFKAKSREQAAKVQGIADAGGRISSGVEDISANTGMLAQDFSAIQQDIKTALDQGDRSMSGFSEIKAQVAILVDTIQVLKENSASIGSISDVIHAISDETNILSLNARIEAARGQRDGKGFKVIAEEVGHLAKQSKEATKDIQNRLLFLGDKISETVTAVDAVEKNVLGCEQQILDANKALNHVCSQFGALSGNLAEINAATEHQSANVRAVAENIRDIEAAAKAQSTDVETIFDIAEKVNAACDGMILDSGVFHLSGHGIARDAAKEMAADAAILSGTRDSREHSLAVFMERFPFIELAYITDAGGRQVTANVYAPGLRSRTDLEQGYGCDWSAKEWFTAPVATRAVFVSEVYRSSATRDFCFTVSVPLVRGDRPAGVLGIDVNFRDMLDI